MGKIKDFFDLDGSFMTFMSKLFWVIIINFVWIVSCLPVISIGGATKAMYSVMFSLVEDKKIDFFGTYLSRLFEHFLTSLKLTITTIAIGAICIIDMLFFLSMESTTGYIMFGISVFIALAFLCIVMCAFPILSLNEKGYKDTIYETLDFIKTYPLSALGVLCTTLIFVGLICLILLIPALFPFVYLLFISFGLNAFVISYIIHKKLVLNN